MDSHFQSGRKFIYAHLAQVSCVCVTPSFPHSNWNWVGFKNRAHAPRCVSPRPSWGCRQSWSRCFGKEGNGEHYNVPRMAAWTEKLISLLEQFSIKTKANGAGVACWEKNRKEDKPKQINIYQGDCLNAYIRQFLIFESPVRSMGFSEARDLYCVHLLVSK